MQISVFDKVINIVLPEKMSTDNAEACSLEIEKALNEHPGCSLSFDAEKLTYISSMGLRVLLKAIKSKGISGCVFRFSGYRIYRSHGCEIKAPKSFGRRL